MQKSLENNKSSANQNIIKETKLLEGIRELKEGEREKITKLRDTLIDYSQQYTAKGEELKQRDDKLQEQLNQLKKIEDANEEGSQKYKNLQASMKQTEDEVIQKNKELQLVIAGIYKVKDIYDHGKQIAEKQRNQSKEETKKANEETKKANEETRRITYENNLIRSKFNKKK